MAATTYTDQQNYVKFLTQQAKASEGCGCGSGSSASECSCCPVGLVALYDDKGQHLGCVTPNDAELYKKNSLVCQDGYVKLINDTTQEFLGCVSEEVYASLNSSVNTHTVDPAGLGIIPLDTTMVTSEQRQFFPSFTPSDTTDQEVTWSIDNSAAASVDGDGVVTAIGPATVILTATSVADSDIVAHRTITITDSIS
jgi:hypothetical protein